jgi:hypothetical protein
MLTLFGTFFEKGIVACHVVALILVGDNLFIVSECSIARSVEEAHYQFLDCEVPLSDTLPADPENLVREKFLVKTTWVSYRSMASASRKIKQAPDWRRVMATGLAHAVG